MVCVCVEGAVFETRGAAADELGGPLISSSFSWRAVLDGAAATLLSTPFTLIGELALISETERPMTAIARQPSTVLKIPRTLFHRVLRDYPASALNMRAMMGMRLEILMRELDKLAKSWDTDSTVRQ